MGLYIRAIGAVSSVGRDARTTCASIRAGITRISPIPEFPVLDIDSHESVPLSGHAIAMLTDGYAAVARWAQMARSAVSDLLASCRHKGEESPEIGSQTSLVLVTPDPQDDRFLFEPNLSKERVQRALVDPLCDLIGTQAREMRWLAAGRIGTFDALASADAMLKRGDCARLLLVVVDSYLDGFSLDWLANQRCLKTDANPAGIMPGEGAVALLIDGGRTAAGRSMPPIGVHAVTAAAPVNEATDARRGQALASVVQGCLQQAKLGAPFEGDMFVDLNGQAWRAREFGSALVQVPQALLGEARQHYAAVSIGDTGAASGAFNLMLAARALERGYAPGRAAMVTASSFGGRVAAAMLQKEA